MKYLIALCVATVTTLPASLLQAQTWPQRPVKVIVPYSAGGLSDTQARVLSERLSAAFGQQFLVENRVGATGAIAAEYVAKSPADGYTLFWATTPQVSIVPLIQKVNYDPLKDFAPVSIFGKNTYVLAVHISIPAKTLKEFIEYVRAHPGQLSYSSAGTGSAGHLSAALFTSRADLPTIAEFYPAFRADTWNGLMAPAATPKRIIDRIAQEVARATRDPGVIERLNKIGVEAYANAPAEFAALIRSEAPQWRDAVNAAGIKQE